MKILFLGAYDNSEIIPAPLKVANKLFSEFETFESLEIKYFTYFYDASRKKKLFGKEKIKHNIFRFGLFPLLQNVLRYKPNIIQIVNPDAFYLPLYFLKPFIKSKIIYHSHSLLPHLLKHYLDDISFYERMRFKIICGIVYKKSDYIFLFTEKEKRYLRRYLEIEEGRIKKIPNGMDDLIIKKNYQKQKWKGKIGFIGSLKRKEKGFYFLIDSLKKINVKVDLHVFDYYPQQLDFNSSKIKLIFEEPMPEYELRKILCEMDCVINSSRYDPFPLIFMEVMNSGILCLFSNKIGQNEILKDEMLDFQFKYGNSENLKSKYLWMKNLSCEEKDRRSKIFMNYSKYFTWDKIAKKYNDVYKQLLD